MEILVRPKLHWLHQLRHPCRSEILAPLLYFQADDQIQVVITAYDSLCGYGGANTGNCETAFSAIEGTCLSLLNTGDSSVCAGTCGTQLSAAVNACESSVSLLL